MKKLTKKTKYVLIALVLILIAVVSIGIWKKEAIERRYGAYQMKRTLIHQLAPFEATLNDMGFDTKKVYATCFKPDAWAPEVAPFNTMQCTASLNSYQVVGSDASKLQKLNTLAATLSKQFAQNGWQERQDFPTIQWFQQITKGIDYQPDQLNHKQFDDMTCTIDFYTAFSKPAPIAMSLRADCSKPRLEFFDQS